MSRRRIRNLVVRLLGLITAVAFGSLLVQVLVLYGERGLLPACSYIESVSAHQSWWSAPTLFRLACSDTILQVSAGAGVVVGLVLFAGFAPLACLGVAWFLYLSFTTVGRDFLHFQWDNLLLESLFFVALVTPAGWRLSRLGEPSRAGSFLLLWLIVRLHVESGLAKLLSGDPTWRDLTAMASYYETAPLPTWVGWYAHQMPEWVHRTTSAYTLVVEIILPLLLFVHRRARAAIVAVLVTLQIGVILTANYTFFNYLSIVLCLFALDDGHLDWLRRRVGAASIAAPPAPVRNGVRAGLAAVMAVILAALALVPFSRWIAPMPWLDPVRQAIAPFRTLNAYHLFASMTLVRREPVIEGSVDGETWRPYEFRYKPGDPQRPPGFVAPHQPRVDFRLWFMLLGPQQQWGAAYFERILHQLLHDPASVAPLFVDDPFLHDPPQHLRVTVYRYRFTDAATRRSTGAWWDREFVLHTQPIHRGSFR